MKTLREILLERHRTADPKLDAIRQNAVALITQKAGRAVPSASSASISSPRETLARTWLSALRSLRWHLAGLAAAWLAIALLNMDHTLATTASIAQGKIPSPRQLMTALRENRRQLME